MDMRHSAPGVKCDTWVYRVGYLKSSCLAESGEFVTVCDGFNLSRLISAHLGSSSTGSVFLLRGVSRLDMHTTALKIYGNDKMFQYIVSQ